MSSPFPATIFDYITTEENGYKTSEIQVLDNDHWNMAEHIQMSLAMKRGKFVEASNDYRNKPPKKNMVLPILRVRYRAEDIDVKDIFIYIEEPEKHHLSFLVKKYWEDVWTVENDFDSFLDKAKEEKIDLGGCLVRKGVGSVPEVIPLQSIAFCDQTDLLGGPIGLKFNFSPGKLKMIAQQTGWGNKENGADVTIDELIKLATQEKDSPSQNSAQQNKTTGKNIEVYIVRNGALPASYLRGDDADTMVGQIQVVAFYRDEKGRQGKTLYKATEKEGVYKFHTSEEIFGRALGLGGVEELFDNQIWGDWGEIVKKNALESGSKNVLWTDDPAYINRNKFKDMEDNEITSIEKGSQIGRVPTMNPNVQLFNEYFLEWERHARELGGATEPLLGKQPPAGTPFRLQERVVFEGKGLHEYRMGKFAKFVEEVMRDWIIPDITKKIVKGKKFLTELTPDEMQFVMEKTATNRAARTQIEQVLNGEIPEDYEALTQKYREEFLKGGNQRFVEILADELRGVELKVKIVISNKQKDLSMMVDKLANVVRQYFATPQMRQDPFALKLLSQLFEASGLNPIDLTDARTFMPSQMQPGNGQALKDMTQQQPVLA
jgi:hypothetical protein